MVIVKLLGGLGNQMFQYAAGRSLSIRHQAAFRLDLRTYERSGNDGYTPRRYALGHFNIRADLATEADIESVRGPPRKGLARIVTALNRRINPLHRPSVFTEPPYQPYNPRIVRTAPDVYLAGYWQSEKYFAGIRDVIRREFTVKEEPGPQSRVVADQIARMASVSIHVRRGDYVSDPDIHRIHGILGLDYYRQAADWVASKVAGAHFYCFSDDPGWVRENLRLAYPLTFVDHNDASRDYDDLWLMSLCWHHIIANSSFSWWGAWLGATSGKVVVAPRQWFRDPGMDTSDLVPDSWIRI
jgi:hypothetical protein